MKKSNYKNNKKALKICLGKKQIMGKFKLKHVRKWFKNTHKQAAGVPTKEVKKMMKKIKKKNKKKNKHKY